MVEYPQYTTSDISVNLRDGGRVPPTTMLTTPRLLQRQQQAYRLRIAFDVPIKGGEFASKYRHPVWYGKTRMVWLPDGENIIFIRFGTTHERDRHTDRQTPHDDIGRAYASHRAAKMDRLVPRTCPSAQKLKKEKKSPEISDADDWIFTGETQQRSTYVRYNAPLNT